MSRPLWLDPERQEYPSLQGDLDVAVAVVGAGFAGLGAAWALQDTNVSVVVLEARSVASGASGRNGGFLIDGPAMSYTEAVRRVGPTQTMEIWELTRENHEIVRGIIEHCGIDCGYLRRGSMTLAASDEEWKELRADAQRTADAGIEVCLVDRQLLPLPFPRRYFGGVYHAGTGELNPAAFLRGLAPIFPPKVRLVERSPVQRILRGDRWSLETPGGRIRAERLILTTNAYTSLLWPAVPISPIRGQVLATDALPRVLVPLPMHADHGFQYWRQTSAGRLVVGGWRNAALETEVGTEEVLNGGVQSELESFAVELLGVPRELISHRWAGIMGFTPDHMPLVGALPGESGLFMAAGYTGHGVAMAFRCGQLCAQLAVGGTAKIPECFSPARFLRV